MDEMAEELLRVFIGVANKETLHPNDRERFYDFILHAHRRNLGISESEVKDGLWASNFSREHAGELAALYLHARALLKQYDATE